MSGSGRDVSNVDKGAPQVDRPLGGKVDLIDLFCRHLPSDFLRYFNSRSTRSIKSGNKHNLLCLVNIRTYGEGGYPLSSL
jgi:hypothetical protein